MAQNIIYSPWEGTKAPWLCLTTKLLLVSFDYFSLVLHSLSSYSTYPLAKVFPDKRQAEDREDIGSRFISGAGTQAIAGYMSGLPFDLRIHSHSSLQLFCRRLTFKAVKTLSEVTWQEPSPDVSFLLLRKKNFKLLKRGLSPKKGPKTLATSLTELWEDPRGGRAWTWPLEKVMASKSLHFQPKCLPRLGPDRPREGNYQ